MKKFFMSILIWINLQIEWIKGFFEEVTPDGRKASQKRLVSFLTVMTFLYSYITILLKKAWTFGDITKMEFPDIPMMWATLIGFIIGANIVSNTISNKVTPPKSEDKNNRNENDQG